MTTIALENKKKIRGVVLSDDIIKELKDTAAFAAAVESAGAPVIVTKHGREEFVSMSMEVYEGMRRQAALAELYRVVDRGLRDVEQGRVCDAGNALAELRERHGL